MPVVWTTPCARWDKWDPDEAAGREEDFTPIAAYERRNSRAPHVGARSSGRTLGRVSSPCVSNASM
ncbi:hypothetical protein GCM10009820_16750 [Leifsonia soli]